MKNLDSLMPVWGYSSYAQIRDAQVPLIKTHRSATYLATLRENGGILLVRSPLATLRSGYRYYSSSNVQPFDGTFDEFILDSQRGATAWNRFHESWLKRTNILSETICYELLREDAISQMSRIYKLIGCPELSGTVAEALERSSLERMQSSETCGVREPSRFRPGFVSVGGSTAELELKSDRAHQEIEQSNDLYEELKRVWNIA